MPSPIHSYIHSYIYTHFLTFFKVDKEFILRAHLGGVEKGDYLSNGRRRGLTHQRTEEGGHGKEGGGELGERNLLWNAGQGL